MRLGVSSESKQSKFVRIDSLYLPIIGMYWIYVMIHRKAVVLMSNGKIDVSLWRVQFEQTARSTSLAKIIILKMRLITSIDT